LHILLLLFLLDQLLSRLEILKGDTLFVKGLQLSFTHT